MAIGVGEYSTARQVLHRLPTNPYDKSTLVSIMPRAIDEFKPTIFPPRYMIPAAKPGDFEVLVIEPASWYLPSQIENMPPTEIQVNSVMLAKSIVDDYVSGIFMCNMQDCMPGFFFVPGDFSKKTIIGYVDKVTSKTFQMILDDARVRQKNWFYAVVQMADQLWAQSNNNPLSISDDARIAAELLQLDKPWLTDAQLVAMINCKACGELVNPNFPICKHCHTILDEEKAKKLGIKFAMDK